MQAPFEMTEGQQRLKSILAELPPGSAHWNEAQNRFQFIDRLLLHCLGWEHPYVDVNTRDDDGGFSDYCLGKPIRAVLEAKREAVFFGDLPIGTPTIVRKLEPLVSASPALKCAAIQAMQYCVLHGAQVAIVCNGPQLVIFQAIVVGDSPLKGECYFFNGFDSYCQYFDLLWRLLSPEGIEENRAYRELALHRNPRIPPKASSALPEPQSYRYRSAFQQDLQALSSLLLEDILLQPAVKRAFYKDCYVPIEANNRHLLLSKRMIETRYWRAASGSETPRRMEGAVSVDESGKLEVSDDLLAEAMSTRPIIVLGDVGVGKTSFFENLFEQLEEDDEHDSYFVHINLGEMATLSEDVKGFILDAVPKILKARYGVDIDSAAFVNTIYYREIEAFEKGIYGALKDLDPLSYNRERVAFLAERIRHRDQHLHSALGHLARGRQKRIVMVIDNADQRSFATQQEAFLIAQELAASGSLIVFVALRPSTFLHSKTSGALSGYQNRVLTIAPPPADDVIQKRIGFAVKIAEGRAAPGSLTGIRLHLESIVHFLKATLRSIRANEQIRIFLGNITGGNTRMVIELISAFCGSPNVDSKKIVDIESTEGDYIVPLHEFTKHALLGEYRYYNPFSSQVACNVYDVSESDPREHFLALLIVAYLSSGVVTKDNDGFTTGATVLREMAQLGFRDDQVRWSLRKLAERRLIETPHGHFREATELPLIQPEGYHYRATSVGIYHQRFWTGQFTFLDAVSTDTPIMDQTPRELVFRLAPSFDIRDRLTKTEAFRAYLLQQWHAANLHPNYLDFAALLQAHDPSFKSVLSSLERNAKRAAPGLGRRPRIRR